MQVGTVPNWLFGSSTVSDRTKTAVYGSCPPDNEYLRVFGINATTQIGDGLKETILVEEWSDQTGLYYVAWFGTVSSNGTPSHPYYYRTGLFNCSADYDRPIPSTFRCVLCY